MWHEDLLLHADEQLQKDCPLLMGSPFVSNRCNEIGFCFWFVLRVCYIVLMIYSLNMFWMILFLIHADNFKISIHRDGVSQGGVFILANQHHCGVILTG